MVKEGEFMRGVALLPADPGATMIQIVTYIGYRVGGSEGRSPATIAFVLPAFFALLILSAIYFRFHSLLVYRVPFQGPGGHCGGHHPQCLYYLRQTHPQRLEG